MRIGTATHRVWLWWGDAYWTVAGREVALPSWPWRIYCALRGHQVIDDQCMRPEHRYCGVCWQSTPHRPTS